MNKFEKNTLNLICIISIIGLTILFFYSVLVDTKFERFNNFLTPIAAFISIYIYRENLIELRTQNAINKSLSVSNLYKEKIITILNKFALPLWPANDYILVQYPTFKVALDVFRTNISLFNYLLFNTFKEDKIIEKSSLINENKLGPTNKILEVIFDLYKTNFITILNKTIEDIIILTNDILNDQDLTQTDKRKLIIEIKFKIFDEYLKLDATFNKNDLIPEIITNGGSSNIKITKIENSKLFNDLIFTLPQKLST